MTSPILRQRATIRTTKTIMMTATAVPLRYKSGLDWVNDNDDNGDDDDDGDYHPSTPCIASGARKR